MGAMTLAPPPLSPLAAEAQPASLYPNRRMHRGAHRQLPPQTGSITVLNKILDVDGALRVDYDIRQPTGSACCMIGQTMHLSGGWLHEMAAMPGLESLTIRASFMGGYPLVVFPRGPSHVVCVEDVLEQVHQAALDHLNGWRASSDSSSAIMNGWKWKGLVASREERDVWILMLQ